MTRPAVATAASLDNIAADTVPAVPAHGPQNDNAHPEACAANLETLFRNAMGSRGETRARARAALLAAGITIGQPVMFSPAIDAALWPLGVRG